MLGQKGEVPLQEKQDKGKWVSGPRMEIKDDI